MPFPEGYTARAPVPADAEPVVALVNAESELLIGTPLIGVDWLSTVWTSPVTDLQNDVAVVVASDGELAGYLFVEAHPPYTSIMGIGVVGVPHFGRGVGSAMLTELERRAHRFVTKSPPGERVVMHMGALADEPRVCALLASRGYVEVRRFSQMRIVFERPPETATVPHGIEIRPLVSGQEPAVHACITEAFRDHWGSSETSYQAWAHDHITADREFDPALWALAWDGDTLAGALVGTTTAEEDPSLGYVAELGVLAAHRGRGIGEALLRSSFVRFHEAGRRGVYLYVDTESITGATRLYQRAGMTQIPRFATWEKELREALPAS